MLDGMLLGLETALSLQNILFAALGCFIGTIIGMLPGLGPMSIVAIMTVSYTHLRAHETLR